MADSGRKSRLKQLFAAKEQLISKTPVSYHHQLDLVASYALAAVPS